MPNIIEIITTISLILIALSFYLVGFLVFRSSKLMKNNSVSTTGILVGFRKYYVTDQWGDNSEDYPNNKNGRVPIFKININGEKLDIAAATFYNELTSKDIGTQFKVRYRSFIGITCAIDEENSLIKYNKKKNILFWFSISLATILLIVSLYLIIR